MKHLLRLAVASPGGWRLVNRFRPAGCAVLMYHRLGEPDDPFPHLPVAEFRRHMEWLVEHGECVAADDLRSRVGTRAGGRLPFLVTFDDGYRSFYDHAYPILRRLGIPAVSFLPTDLIDRPRLPWWDLLHLAVHASKRPRVFAEGVSGDGQLELRGDGRKRYLRLCKARIKRASACDVDALLAGIAEALDVELASLAASRQYMTWDEVRASADLTTFGGHTHTHPLLTKVDRVVAAAEIRTCRERIAAATGRAPRVFAYPSGDFDEQVQAVTANCGFDTAFSTVEGLARPDTDWLAVKRVSAERPLTHLAWGIWRTWFGPASP
ncbi:MAG: polysaccharide deacetylase family protein [Gemmatimonadales bacterium]|nr:polysaccharide deacetylase family protein [Gemmatimonadales bacterium]